MIYEERPQHLEEMSVLDIQLAHIRIEQKEAGFWHTVHKYPGFIMQSLLLIICWVSLNFVFALL